MHPHRSSLTCMRVLFLLSAVLIFAGTSFATTEKVVYNFAVNRQPDGVSPSGTLVADGTGNLYGTTVNGGTDSSCSCGTVFELSPPTTVGGSWTETILYSFEGGSDGSHPSNALIFDVQGNLYGTTPDGGNNNRGTVFELSPPATAGGSWTETVLWRFPDSRLRGYIPASRLVLDAAGNLYGTTQFGGANFATCNCGTVFELVKPTGTSTSWAERVLYNFGAVANDGTSPSPYLVLHGGVLYGTTTSGGTHNDGTVFQLTRQPGLWAETVLFNFSGTDGDIPQGITADAVGNLFGVAYGGGSVCDCGVIYELSPPAVAGNPWTHTTLYNFTGKSDGAQPAAPLIRDAAGDLFGTSRNAPLSRGSAFKLKAPSISGGAWSLAVLHDFGFTAGDGMHPVGGLVQVNGVYYGTTPDGGSFGGGTVYSLQP
jgi:uncharacterized repeat protein (TIGR03803 family)